jgi:hypothetical protein
VRQAPFSCFARPESFSAVLRASGPVFMFCAPRLIFDGTEGDSVRAMNRPRTRTRSTINSQLEDTLNSQQDKRGDKLNSR